MLTHADCAADDVLMKVAVSIALAQSTRISVQEAQVIEIVYETKDLPNQLAETGRVSLSHGKLAQLIGSIFLQKSALNLQVRFALLSWVLTGLRSVSVI